MVDQNPGGPGCIFIPDSDDLSSESFVIGGGVRICGSEDYTDSNSDIDCVFIDRRIVKRKEKGEGESSSNFTDSQCDPRFSSCDTDSEGSSDSHTSSSKSQSVVAPDSNGNSDAECEEFKDN
jgi:hypothetical protein